MIEKMVLWFCSVGVRAVPGGSESSGWCSGGEGSLEEPDDAFAAVLDALAAENHQLKRQLADACERVAKTTKVLIITFISYGRRRSQYPPALKYEIVWQKCSLSIFMYIKSHVWKF